MVDGATKSFQQSYNCQAAVDERDQVIVASGVTQDTNNKLQIKPLVKTIKTNSDSKLPKRISADVGYFSEDNCEFLASEEVQGYIATEKTNQLLRAKTPAARGRIPESATITERMTRKLHSIKGRLVYEKRKQIVELYAVKSKKFANFTALAFVG